MNDHFFKIAVKAVRRWFYKTLNNGSGTHCPVCDRYAKIQARPINKTMAQAVAWMVRNGAPSQWIKMSDSPFSGTNQHPTLKHWGLLEQKMNDSNPKKKHVGYWRVTQKGRDFVSGKLAVPEKAVIYNDKLIEMQGPTKYIHEVIKGFDYSEIMKPVTLEGEHTLNG